MSRSWRVFLEVSLYPMAGQVATGVRLV